MFAGSTYQKKNFFFLGKRASTYQILSQGNGDFRICVSMLWIQMRSKWSTNCLVTNHYVVQDINWGSKSNNCFKKVVHLKRWLWVEDTRTEMWTRETLILIILSPRGPFVFSKWQIVRNAKRWETIVNCNGH